MAEEILVGTTNQGPADCVANRFYLSKHLAVQNGSCVSNRFYCGGSSNVKIALYADNAGEPGALIAYNNTGQAMIGSGWKIITAYSASIVSGINYWLAFILETTGSVQLVTSGGIGRYRTETYSTFTFPDPAGTGFSTNAYLYSVALWGEATPLTYTMIYNGNDNTGGTAPTDGSSPYAANAEVTVLDNTGSLVKSGYIFKGEWNTAADGSGTAYAPSATFNINANTILYAQWSAIPAYPAKIIVAGGQGTRADASDNNGGCFSSDSDYASFQGANGAPLYTVTGCVYDTDTGKITKAASFATGLEGVWVNTREGAAGGWIEKRYWIQASDANSITIGAGLGSNADIDVWVGGALKTLEEMLAEGAEASGGFDSGYNAEFDIHYGASIIKIDYPDGSLELSNGDSVTLDVPAGSGGAGSLINGGLINAI